MYSGFKDGRLLCYLLCNQFLEMSVAFFSLSFDRTKRQPNVFIKIAMPIYLLFTAVLQYFVFSARTSPAHATRFICGDPSSKTLKYVNKTENGTHSPIARGIRR